MRASSNFTKKKQIKSKSAGQSGEIRIIGGQWRGRKLKVHDKEGLRPTTDRLKETLFNWLMMDIRDAKILDCFAGAGSLSFEAASRGASSIICIEKDKQAAEQLKSNCQTLNANTQITVQQGDFFTRAKQLSETFDVIFIDPPFHKDMVNRAFQIIVEDQLIEVGSLIYLEQENNSNFNLLSSPWAEHFNLKKEKKAGQVSAQLFEVVTLG